MHSVLFNLCLTYIAAARGEYSLFHSGIKGFLFYKHGPGFGEPANNCPLLVVVQSVSKNETIILHQLPNCIVSWKKKLRRLWGTVPCFSIWSLALVLLFYMLLQLWFNVAEKKKTREQTIEQTAGRLVFKL